MDRVVDRHYPYSTRIVVILDIRLLKNGFIIFVEEKYNYNIDEWMWEKVGKENVEESIMQKAV